MTKGLSGFIRTVVRFLPALICGLWAVPATATFLNAPGQTTGCNPPAVFTQTELRVFCSWNQAVPGTTGPLGGLNWSAILTDSIIPPGTTATNLTLKLTHLFNSPGEVNAPTLTLNAGSIPAGSRGAGAGTVSHTGIDPMTGTGFTNTDAYRYLASTPAGGAGPMLSVTGSHLSGTTRPFRWSVTPPAVAGGLSVSESRANGTVNTPLPPTTQVAVTTNGVVAIGPLGPQPRKLAANVSSVSGMLGPGATDYTIRYTAGDPFFSDTTLSFITGSAGTFEEADLGLMTDFFMGDQEFFVPEVFDANSMAGLSMQDLYVGVDLTQWLSFSSPFSVGPSPISVCNGTSSSLPGFLVATPMPDGSSPITFDPNVGYTAPDANRFCGTVAVGGLIDGQAVVPEPRSLVLLGMGIATLVLSHRARNRAARA